MLTYNPTVLQQLATSLDRRARTLTISRTLLGLLAGAVAAVIVSDVVGDVAGESSIMVWGAVLGGVLGYTSARSQAFALRVQAQTIMSQVVIAHNVGLAASHLEALRALWMPQES